MLSSTFACAAVVCPLLLNTVEDVDPEPEFPFGAAAAVAVTGEPDRRGVPGPVPFSINRSCCEGGKGSGDE